MKRICWLSAGVSSFIAGYIADRVDNYIYIDVGDQHPDSLRFIRDCEKVFESRAKMERDLGHTIINGIYLDELEPDRGRNKVIMESCSLLCEEIISNEPVQR